jgi:hypothetical protein
MGMQSKYVYTGIQRVSYSSIRKPIIYKIAVKVLNGKESHETSPDSSDFMFMCKYMKKLKHIMP